MYKLCTVATGSEILSEYRYYSCIAVLHVDLDPNRVHYHLGGVGRPSYSYSRCAQQLYSCTAVAYYYEYM